MSLVNDMQNLVDEIVQAISSREVAEMMEVQHKHLLEKIDKINADLVAENLATKKYWIESTFENRGKQYREYQVTKLGCEFLAHKSTGTKGNLFTARYMDRFEEMEQYIKQQEVPQLSAENQAILDIVNATDKTETALAVRNFKEIITKPLNETIQIQADVIEEMKPAVVVKEALDSSTTSILIRDFAKTLKQNGIDTGEKRLFEWMRESGYLIKRKGSDYNMPTQKSMDLGLFEVKQTNIVHSNGRVTTSRTPKVTGKGQSYFLAKLLAPKETKLTKSLQGVIECT